MTYNPSKRRNPRLKIKQIQSGILEYSDEIGKVLIAIETRELGSRGLYEEDPINPERELKGVQWGIGSETSVGDRVLLCPRDIWIFRELIDYLEEQGINVGDETKVSKARRKSIFSYKLNKKGKMIRVKKP